MHEKLGIGADNINDHTAPPSLTDSFDELFEFPYIFWPQKKIKFQKPDQTLTFLWVCKINLLPKHFFKYILKMLYLLVALAVPLDFLNHLR